MKKLPLVPILAFALAACADQSEPFAPLAMNADVQATSSVWFATDPPQPALVGETYDVVVRASGAGYGSLDVYSLTPWVCSLQGTYSDGSTEWRGTATFLEAGECGLYADNSPYEAYQIFDVYEPNETPAPYFKTCTKSTRSGQLEIRIPLDQSCPIGWD
jgi:hypothetical protein